MGVFFFLKKWHAAKFYASKYINVTPIEVSRSHTARLVVASEPRQLRHAVTLHTIDLIYQATTSRQHCELGRNRFAWSLAQGGEPSFPPIRAATAGLRSF